jgi:hypothetical protein
MTLDDIVARMEPYLKRAVKSEVPWGARTIVYKYLAWKVKRTFQLGIAMHGHQVAQIVGGFLQLGEGLFIASVTTALIEVKKLCETPLKELASDCADITWLEDARAECGQPAMIRSSDHLEGI